MSIEYITLYHNTSNQNAIKISKEGIIPGLRLNAYGKGSEAESSGIWCSTVRGYGYGGATITFRIDKNDSDLVEANSTEYVLYRPVSVEDILDIDLVVATNIMCNSDRKDSINTTVESDITNGINVWGKDKLLNVYKKYQQNFVKPYDYDKLVSLVETGNKLLKGSIMVRENIVESVKLEEASRNELIYITKRERDLRSKEKREKDPNGPHSDRFERSKGYKGFSVTDIDTSKVLSDNALLVLLEVGDYVDTIELEDILYWVQISAENSKRQNGGNQINTKVVTQALMNAIDGFDLKLNCTCKDWQYRFAYQASLLGYKYGDKEGRPNEDARANPDNRGGVCKHLTAVLSNKRWLQKVTSIFMNWLEQNIEGVNKYLGLKKDRALTLPNDLARQNAKLSWQLRRDNNEEIPEEQPEEKQVPTSNVQGNNPSTNKFNNINDSDVEVPEEQE